jgi:ATP-dependent protease ClpP protease subunit
MRSNPTSWRGSVPNFNQILNEIQAAGSAQDIIRRQYIARLHEYTKRNVIVYYSGWLQKQGAPGAEINDEDKNGFMTVIHELDRSLGLDLLLHTPGGDLAATESLVDYLRSMFGTDIRAIVPQLSMSAGTMMACAARNIIMGKESSLGAIDPQIAGIPAHGVVEEFRRAIEEARSDPASIPMWQPIIARYSPSLVGICEKAIEWSTQITRSWLETGMFSGGPDATNTIDRILMELGDHAITKSHSRHISAARCAEIGLKVQHLEADSELQEVVLSVHHACMLTLSTTHAVKIIENHRGVAFIKAVQPVPRK